MNLIKYILKKLEIKTKTYVSSELECDNGDRNERLVNICNHFDAKIYLSGTGAKQYNDKELFLENNIEIKYSNFNPRGDLTNYSILHSIFLNGYDKTRELLMEKNINSASK